MNQHQTDDVTIVAGGWSASKVDLTILPGKIIGVNDAWKYLPRCDVVVSMDRLWAENRWKELCKRMTPAWIRRAALKRMPNLHLPWLRVFDCDHTTHEMSEQDGVLNGTNSGLCAVNLALTPLVRPRRRLWLVGFDMQLGPKKQAHWHPDYPWKHKGSANTKIEADWFLHFKDAKKKFDALGIEVFNVSHRSKIKDFRQIMPEQFPGLLATLQEEDRNYPGATPDFMEPGLMSQGLYKRNVLGEYD